MATFEPQATTENCVDDGGLLAFSLTKNMQKLKEFSQQYRHEPARGTKWIKPRSLVLI